MGDGYGLEELIVVQVVGVEHGRGITVGGAAGGDDTADSAGAHGNRCGGTVVNGQNVTVS